VICHSDKEHAAPTFKHTFGYHPMLAPFSVRDTRNRNPANPELGAGTRAGR
jgi:hypothetical protein